MEGLDPQTVIAICSFLALLCVIMFGVIQASVWPLKYSIKKLEQGQAKLESKLDQLLAQKA